MKSQASLLQQGYICKTKELRSISNGLRFTPVVCMMLAMYGLYLQNPYFHYIIAALGIIPFWFPKGHPFDMLYNQVVRKIIQAPRLPPNPLPRRIACLMGGTMNIFIGVSFHLGNPVAAYIIGAMLIFLQLIVISTHFCLASYLYEYALKLVGKWKAPISLENAKNLLKKGALLVDVRNPDEFSHGTIEGSINIPLSELEYERLKGKAVLLYCKSGIRSAEGREKLRVLGHPNVYNLGSMSRWKAYAE